MLGIFSEISKYYHIYNYEKADHRTRDWFLLKSPIPVAATIAIYLWFCLKAGPYFMKDRKPFKLKKTIIRYNLFQFLFSLAMFIGVLIAFSTAQVSLSCLSIDLSDTKQNLWFMAGSYTYFIAKLTELIETIFFILRKKYSQVSTLHLYHHSSMIVIAWFTSKYLPVSHIIVPGSVNTFVHVVMYFYYYLSSLGPKYQKYLWWKRQLTMMQILQFFIGMASMLNALLTGCDYPKVLSMLCVVQGIIFTYMFGKFYVDTYILKKDGRSKRLDVKSNGTSSESSNNNNHCEKKD